MAEPLTARQLIEQLQALSEEDKDKPVYCSYDISCRTAVYGVGIEQEAVILNGD